VVGEFDFYGPQYRKFGTDLAAEMRREVYGEDLGQQGWRTAAEQAHIADLLRINGDSNVLDVACGSGGPSLALARYIGCRLTGLDVEAIGIEYAKNQASGLGDRVTFAICDCNSRLPFDDGCFDAILCIDAITHFRDRFRILEEWTRLLCPGGRLVFTDSAVITGGVAKSELDIRTTTGFFLFVPPGLDEKAIQAAGLALLHKEDRTAAVAEIAARWHDVRARHAAALRRDEGTERFEQLQRYYTTTTELAESGRLSRFLYVAEKTL
jgi:SAM-dependent methyltransferase